MFLPQPPGFNWFSIFSKSSGTAKIIAIDCCLTISPTWWPRFKETFCPSLRGGWLQNIQTLIATSPQNRAGTKKAGAFSRFDSRTWTSSIARHGFHYVQLWIYKVFSGKNWIAICWRYKRYISAFNLIFMYSIYLQHLQYNILCIYIYAVSILFVASAVETSMNFSRGRHQRPPCPRRQRAGSRDALGIPGSLVWRKIDRKAPYLMGDMDRYG